MRGRSEGHEGLPEASVNHVIPPMRSMGWAHGQYVLRTSSLCSSTGLRPRPKVRLVRTNRSRLYYSRRPRATRHGPSVTWSAAMRGGRRTQGGGHVRWLRTSSRRAAGRRSSGDRAARAPGRAFATVAVAAWAEPVLIDTYPLPDPDRNPLFLERRVYQGSSGRVYPNRSPTASPTCARRPAGRPSTSRTSTCA